jgi:hypothetical protein
MESPTTSSSQDNKDLHLHSHDAATHSYAKQNPLRNHKTFLTANARISPIGKTQF